MALQINSNKINNLLSLLFPGAFAKLRSAGRVSECVVILRKYQHIIQTQPVFLTAVQAADAAVFIRRKAFRRHLSF